MPEIHGHRGARALRPENTLSGLAYALAIGVDAIEFDVTLTAEGGLILAHDLVVNAQTTLDTGPATEGDPDFPYVGKRWSVLTLPQIATLNAGGRRPVSPIDCHLRLLAGFPAGAKHALGVEFHRDFAAPVNRNDSPLALERG